MMATPEVSERARQRYQRGAEHIRSKLTTREVREIRDLEGRFSQISLGEKYGVSQKTISAIQRRATWRHVR